MVAKTLLTLTEKQTTRFKRLVWAFSIGFILHNLEELLRMPAFLSQHIQEFPVFFQQIASIWQPKSFSLAIWMLNGLAIGLAIILTRNLSSKWAHLTLSFLAGMMVINALMHLGQSLYLQNIVPGVITAMLLILPISSYLIIHELRLGWITKKVLLMLLATGLVSMPLLIWLIMGFSGLLTGG